MNCSLPCGLCKRLIIVKNITISKENLVLTVDDKINLENLKNYCFLICSKIPTSAKTLNTVVDINGTNYNLYCKKGNYIKGCQLISGKKYIVVFGNNPNHFLILSNVCMLQNNSSTTPSTPSTPDTPSTDNAKEEQNE